MASCFTVIPAQAGNLDANRGTRDSRLRGNDNPHVHSRTLSNRRATSAKTAQYHERPAMMLDRIKSILPAWILAWIFACTSCNVRTDRSPSVAEKKSPDMVSDKAFTPGSADGHVQGPFQFADVADEVGLRFHHYSPLTEKRHVHLVMGSGIGWLDFDRDGIPDLFCCQGASFAESNASQETSPPSDELYWNRGEEWSEVAQHAGLTDAVYSMGVATADFDNDGFVDLCVTGYGENRVYHNAGDGTFQPVAVPSSSQPGRLSASCAWGDIDQDGNLDLFVTNYAQLGPKDYPVCSHTAGDRTISIVCHPAHLKPLPDLLYRNGGNGTFNEVSNECGISATARQGLGVLAADLDRDGDTDFYVANDTTPNQLWQNDGTGHFTDRGVDSGTATNRHGASEAGMGLGVGDVDGNGEFDLFVTNFYYETNTLYRNEGRLQFADVTDEMGLGAPSRLRLGFGTSLADFNHDGWLDIFITNGHIHDQLDKIGQDEPFEQLPLMFQNRQGSVFADVTSASGEYFRAFHVGRGSAVADFDRDGDLDLAVNHLNRKAALLRNNTNLAGSWIRLDLVGKESNRGAIGAVVSVDDNERKLVRPVTAGASYLSCDEATLLIGVGPSKKTLSAEVSWPSGRQEKWTSLEVNRDYRFVEGTGQPIVSAVQ